MPVVDASVLIAYLTGSEQAEQARAKLLGAGEPLWAPHLVDAEVGHGLRRALRAGLVSATQAQSAVEEWQDVRIVRAGHLPLMPRAWELRDNISFYDAMYVSLAEELGMSLITFDRRLAGAPGLRAPIDIP